MPYNYTIKIDLVDENEERFWQGYLVQPFDSPATPAQIEAAVSNFISSHFQQDEYEELETWLDEHDTWSVDYATQYIYVEPP